MRKLKKSAVKLLLATIVLTAGMTLFRAIFSYAGTCEQTGDNYRYKNDDGTYVTDAWKIIDGKFYYFDQNGGMLSNITTSDGYALDENGAWTGGEVAQTQNTNNAGENTKVEADISGISVYGGDLSAKTYDGIEFSIENLGVSQMALGSIINPSANTTTAHKILDYKQYYNNGTDRSWISQEEEQVVDAFITLWKEEHISANMSEEEKFKAIYDYMNSTITYDKEAPNGQSSYGAFIDKRCVCGGYSNGFLKLARSCGLDAKFIFIPDHSFNLICVSGKWYATDITQEEYNNRSTAGVYYMHVTPELDTSIQDKVNQINERNQNKEQTTKKSNDRYQESIDQAVSKNAVFNISDGNLIEEILDYAVNTIDTNSAKLQYIPMVLYTDGKNFTEFHKMQFDYNGKHDKINKIIVAELAGKSVGGHTIKEEASCYIRYKIEVQENGMDTFARLWTDEAGKNFVLLECWTQLQ